MWRRVKLNEVAKWVRGLTYSKNDEVESDGIAVLRATNIDLATHRIILDDIRYISEAAKVHDEKYAKVGDLLVCTASGSKSHVGKVAIVEEDLGMTFGGFMAALRCDERCIPRFLYHVLTSPNFKRHLASLGDGANINNLKFSQIESYEIHLPPLAEQQRIVAKLDSAFAEIDRAIELSTEQLKQSELLVQKLIDEKFSFEGRSVSFDFIVQSKGTGLERRANLQSPDNDFPYLKMNNITSSNALNIENYTAVNASEDEVMKYKLQEGDFLFNTRNSVELVGKTAVVHGLDSWLFNNNILRVKFIEEFNPDYVNYYFCTSEGKRQLAARKTGTTNVAAIYYKDLKTVEIPFANTNDQNSISSKIEQQIDQCSIYQHCLKEKIIQHQNLKSAILAQELQQSEAA